MRWLLAACAALRDDGRPALPHVYIDEKERGLEAFYRPPLKAEPAALCVTGSLPRVQPEAIRSWAHARFPLRAVVYLVVAGSEAQRAPGSEYREAVTAIYDEGILDGVMFVDEDRDAPAGATRIDQVLSQLDLEGDDLAHMLLQPGGKPFGPFFDSLPLRRQCLLLLNDAETRVGREFTYVGFGRVDYYWWLNHPPLEALSGAVGWLQARRHVADSCGRVPDANTSVWIPSGEDYGGVNDRYVLAPRWAASRLAGMWDVLSSRSQRRALMEWGHGFGFALSDGSMERLLLLFLRRLALCVLRFSNVGAILRTDLSEAGIYRFAYAYESVYAEALGVMSRPLLAPRWAVNGLAEHGELELLVLPEACTFVARSWCDPQVHLFGGPVEAWSPERVPKLYSLAHCCSLAYTSPLLVALPPDGYAGPDCLPELDHTFHWYEDYGIKPKAHSQGLALCFQRPAITRVVNEFPEQVWASEPIWNVWQPRT